MGLVVGKKMKALLFSTPSNDNITTVSNRHVCVGRTPLEYFCGNQQRAENVTCTWYSLFADPVAWAPEIYSST